MKPGEQKIYTVQEYQDPEGTPKRWYSIHTWVGGRVDTTWRFLSYLDAVRFAHLNNIQMTCVEGLHDRAVPPVEGEQ